MCLDVLLDVVLEALHSGLDIVHAGLDVLADVLDLRGVDLFLDPALDLLGRLLEFPEGLADRPAELGELLGAEDEQGNDEEEDEFHRPDAPEHVRLAAVL